MLFAMLSGSLPFREASFVCRRYARHVTGARNFAPWNRFSAETTQVLERMLEPNPARRITLAELRQCSWLRPCPDCA